MIKVIAYPDRYEAYDDVNELLHKAHLLRNELCEHNIIGIICECKESEEEDADLG